jgi:hypothetical protein
MTFICIDLDTGRHIGDCTLSPNQYDSTGTEHMFGDELYVLQETQVGTKGVMYFRQKRGS